MTVRDGQPWELIVICLSDRGTSGATQPGMELVAFYRAKDLKNITMLRKDEVLVKLDRLIGI